MIGSPPLTIYCRWKGVRCASQEAQPSCDLVTYLDVSGFGLDGIVPPSLGDLYAMGYFRIAQNPRLIGQIPDKLFRNMSMIQYVELWDTGLHGALPSFASCSDLTYLDVSFTNIDAINIQNCTRLQQINFNSAPIRGFQ